MRVSDITIGMEIKHYQQKQKRREYNRRIQEAGALKKQQKKEAEEYLELELERTQYLRISLLLDKSLERRMENRKDTTRSRLRKSYIAEHPEKINGAKINYDINKKGHYIEMIFKQNIFHERIEMFLDIFMNDYDVVIIVLQEKLKEFKDGEILSPENWQYYFEKIEMIPPVID
ncbi:MAG: hypothetical protein OIN86_13180 [Candidatus Methanoperedens sp.]|nr:hypothetical protein [Candidatus Methanoperedens sp.]CAG0949257.1 hypothetical protein METP1_00093 [Methanosarcinales archaeon]